MYCQQSYCRRPYHCRVPAVHEAFEQIGCGSTAATGMYPYHPQWPPGAGPPLPPGVIRHCSSPHSVPYPPPMPIDNPASDELRTIFISGLPDNVKQRELQNLLRWFPGYEAATVIFKGEHPHGFALFASQQYALSAKDELQDMVFDEECESVLHADMAKRNLNIERGIVADSAFDHSKHMRARDVYTYNAYPTSPFHPAPAPAPVWVPHGYMLPVPPPYGPYATYVVSPVPKPAPVPVPAPSSLLPVQNSKD